MATRWSLVWCLLACTLIHLTLADRQCIQNYRLFIKNEMELLKGGEGEEGEKEGVMNASSPKGEQEDQQEDALYFEELGLNSTKIFQKASQTLLCAHKLSDLDMPEQCKHVRQVVPERVFLGISTTSKLLFFAYRFVLNEANYEKYHFRNILFAIANECLKQVQEQIALHPDFQQYHIGYGSGANLAQIITHHILGPTKEANRSNQVKLITYNEMPFFSRAFPHPVNHRNYAALIYGGSSAHLKVLNGRPMVLRDSRMLGTPIMVQGAINRQKIPPITAAFLLQLTTGIGMNEEGLKRDPSLEGRLKSLAESELQTMLTIHEHGQKAFQSQSRSLYAHQQDACAKRLTKLLQRFALSPPGRPSNDGSASNSWIRKGAVYFGLAASALPAPSPTLLQSNAHLITCHARSLQKIESSLPKFTEFSEKEDFIIDCSMALKKAHPLKLATFASRIGSFNRHEEDCNGISYEEPSQNSEAWSTCIKDLYPSATDLFSLLLPYRAMEEPSCEFISLLDGAKLGNNADRGCTLKPMPLQDQWGDLYEGNPEIFFSLIDMTTPFPRKCRGQIKGHLFSSSQMQFAQATVTNTLNYIDDMTKNASPQTQSLAQKQRLPLVLQRHDTERYKTHNIILHPNRIIINEKIIQEAVNCLKDPQMVLVDCHKFANHWVPNVCPKFCSAGQHGQNLALCGSMTFCKPIRAFIGLESVSMRKWLRSLTPLTEILRQTKVAQYAIIQFSDNGWFYSHLYGTNFGLFFLQTPEDTEPVALLDNQKVGKDGDGTVQSTSSNPASTSSNPASTSSNPPSTSSNLSSTSSNPPSTSSNPASTSSNPASTSPNPPSTSSNPPSTSSNPASTNSNLSSTSSNPPSTSSNPPSTSSNPPSTTQTSAKGNAVTGMLQSLIGSKSSSP